MDDAGGGKVMAPFDSTRFTLKPCLNSGGRSERPMRWSGFACVFGVMKMMMMIHLLALSNTGCTSFTPGLHDSKDDECLRHVFREI